MNPMKTARTTLAGIVLAGAAACAPMAQTSQATQHTHTPEQRAQIEAELVAQLPAYMRAFPDGHEAFTEVGGLEARAFREGNVIVAALPEGSVTLEIGYSSDGRLCAIPLMDYAGADGVIHDGYDIDGSKARFILAPTTDSFMRSNTITRADSERFGAAGLPYGGKDAEIANVTARPGYHTITCR